MSGIKQNTDHFPLTANPYPNSPRQFLFQSKNVSNKLLFTLSNLYINGHYKAWKKANIRN